ncbi:hypothetical protein SteCoe_22664 [Stentor coeruleus]|uniref:Uncharacterized protein n=1 Tax=Stentor coeruleus TaxID=5963 RepID=A0A1R2BLG3_9CILI|nr:hypothetical protein SteCoe_22664 [Stentor coeruleus]
MGCCTSIKSSMVAPSLATKPEASSSLLNARDSLVKEILRLHNIILNCKQGIETCVLTDKKAIAFTLKQKQLLIEMQKKELQSLVAMLDSCIEESKVNREKKSYVLEQTRKTLKQSTSSITNEDVKNIIENKKKSVDQTKKMTKKLNLSPEEIQNKIDQEFGHRNQVVKTSGEFVRRKFNKQTKVIV